MKNLTKNNFTAYYAPCKIRCENCKKLIEKGKLVVLREGNVSQCQKCADLNLDHLVFLPSGNSSLTRRATRHSELAVEVREYAPAMLTVRRQGILIEPEALEKARKECEADKVRYRRKEIAYFSPSKRKCSNCGRRLKKSGLQFCNFKLIVLREGDVSRCPTCAGFNLDHLKFLRSGDSALTQRATKYSELVVEVRWDRGRGPREGIFVEPEALERARKEWKAAKEIRGVIDYLTSEPKL